MWIQVLMQLFPRPSALRNGASAPIRLKAIPNRNDSQDIPNDAPPQVSNLGPVIKCKVESEQFLWMRWKLYLLAAIIAQ